MPCMRMSVVINTYNRIETLPSTLDALRKQTYSEFEVVVVNGPSDDGTAAFLDRHSGQIKLAACAERNIGRSRNIGVDMAAGEIVAFIDDDAVPSEHWIEKLVAAYGNPLTAAAGGPVFDLRHDKSFGVFVHPLGSAMSSPTRHHRSPHTSARMPTHFFISRAAI